MWENIYDKILQYVTVDWATFLSIHQSKGRAVRDSFQNSIYPVLGPSLLFITLAFSVFYYYYLNYRFGRYYSLKSWFTILIVCFITVWMVTYVRTKSLLNNPDIDVSNHLFWIGTINALYSAILFLLFALLMKWGSPMGKRTPF